MSRFLLVSLSLSFTLLWSPLDAQNKIQDQDLIPGELIVRLAPNVAIEDFIRQWSIQRAQAIALKKSLGNTHNIHLLQFNEQQANAQNLLQRIRQNKQVIAAQFNEYVDFRGKP